MLIARLSGRWPGVPRAPRGSFLGRRDGFRWSGGVREGLDTLPGGDDRRGPGPGGGDLEGLAAAAAHESGGRVVVTVAQRLPICFLQLTVRCQVTETRKTDEAR